MQCKRCIWLVTSTARYAIYNIQLSVTITIQHFMVRVHIISIENIEFVWSVASNCTLRIHKYGYLAYSHESVQWHCPVNSKKKRVRIFSDMFLCLLSYELQHINKNFICRFMFTVQLNFGKVFIQNGISWNEEYLSFNGIS